jgi:hypothetical protein
MPTKELIEVLVSKQNSYQHIVQHATKDTAKEFVLGYLTCLQYVLETIKSDEKVNSSIG